MTSSRWTKDVWHNTFPLSHRVPSLSLSRSVWQCQNVNQQLSNCHNIKCHVCYQSVDQHSASIKCWFSVFFSLHQLFSSAAAWPIHGGAVLFCQKISLRLGVPICIIISLFRISFRKAKMYFSLGGNLSESFIGNTVIIASVYFYGNGLFKQKNRNCLIYNHKLDCN